jgi:hypothetical protein
VRIIPLTARITDQGSFLSTLDEALHAVENRKLKISTTDGNDSDCTSLRKLIIHIANTLLASKISQFVKEFELPVPIKLFSNLSLTDLQVSIVDNLLVVYSRVSKINTQGFDEAQQLIAEIGEFLSRPIIEIHAGKDKSAKILEKISGFSTTSEWITDEATPTVLPNRGIFLMIHQRLLQLLAETILVYKDGKEECSEWWIFRFCYDWSIRIWDPVVRIAGNRVRLSAKLRGSAGAKVCIETHCGDVCHRIGASATGEPPITSRVYFKKPHQPETELWVDPDLMGPFFIDWDVDGLPWPFNKFVEWFLEALSAFSELFIFVWLLRFKMRISTFPKFFPGTSMEFISMLDTEMKKVPNIDALVGVGELDFKPDI